MEGGVGFESGRVESVEFREIWGHGASRVGLGRPVLDHVRILDRLSKIRSSQYGSILILENCQVTCLIGPDFGSINFASLFGY